MSDFRFLHAADIHLDSPLTGLAQFEEAAATRIQTASRDAFDNLIQYAIDEDVEFVVIAGDLYDGDWKDHRTGLFFVQQMGRLADEDIPAYILHGNHDAASQITKSLRLPENVQVFPYRKPGSFVVKYLDVVLHGQSFPEQHVTDNLVPNYPARMKGHFNIGVLHTALEGSTLHASYAPCSIEELTNKGYDYWALGHVHAHAIIETNPYVVFPGNLQGRSIREIGPKGACLVSIDGGAVASVEHVPFDVTRWAVLELDVTKSASFDRVLDQIGTAISDAVDTGADGRLLACRIRLTGKTSLDGELRSRLEELRTEAIATTLHRGEAEAWIEKIRLETEPQQDAAAIAEREDALGELFRTIPEALEDEAFQRSLGDTLQAFCAKLDHDVIKAPDDLLLQAAVDSDLKTLVNGVRDELMATLMRRGD